MSSGCHASIQEWAANREILGWASVLSPDLLARPVLDCQGVARNGVVSASVMSGFAHSGKVRKTRILLFANEASTGANSYVPKVAWA